MERGSRIEIEIDAEEVMRGFAELGGLLSIHMGSMKKLLTTLEEWARDRAEFKTSVWLSILSISDEFTAKALRDAAIDKLLRLIEEAERVMKDDLKELEELKESLESWR